MICFIRLKSAVLACIVSWLCHISQLLIGILHFISLIFFFILVTFYLKSSLFHYNKSYLYGWFTRIALSLVTSAGISGISVIVVRVWDKCAHFADCLYNSIIRVCLWQPDRYLDQVSESFTQFLWQLCPIKFIGSLQSKWVCVTISEMKVFYVYI